MASKKRRPKRRRETPPPKKRRRPSARKPKPEPAPTGTDELIAALKGGAKSAALSALEEFERDPDTALTKLERLGQAGGALLEHLHKHPTEAKRAARNAALSGLAKFLKRSI